MNGNPSTPLDNYHCHFEGIYSGIKGGLGLSICTSILHEFNVHLIVSGSGGSLNSTSDVAGI